MPFSRSATLTLLIAFMQLLVACTPSEQAQLQTLVAEAGQKAIAEGENLAKTQVAQLKETVQARIATEAANIKSTLVPENFHTIMGPPFDACVGKSIISITSPPANSDEIIEEGFGNASYFCDAERGAINNTILLFGGKSGSILEPPNYETDISSGMEFGFTPSFTGNLRVDVTLSVSSKTGAAAGSAMALLDFRDVISKFLLPTQIGAFLDISKSLIFQTASGVRTDAYIYVETNSAHDETTTLVGGRGFGASFPLPPNSQSAEFSSEQVTLSLTTPVTGGEKVYIGTGIRTTARVHGWAVAYWNPSKEQEVIVTSVELTEEK